MKYVKAATLQIFIQIGTALILSLFNVSDYWLGSISTLIGISAFYIFLDYQKTFKS